MRESAATTTTTATATTVETTSTTAAPTVTVEKKGPTIGPAIGTVTMTTTQEGPGETTVSALLAVITILYVIAILTIRFNEPRRTRRWWRQTLRWLRREPQLGFGELRERAESFRRLLTRISDVPVREEWSADEERDEDDDYSPLADAAARSLPLLTLQDQAEIIEATFSDRLRACGAKEISMTDLPLAITGGAIVLECLRERNQEEALHPQSVRERMTALFEAEAAVPKMQNQLHEAERKAGDTEALLERLGELNDQIAGLRKTDGEKDTDISRLNAELESAQERIRELQATNQQLSNDLGQRDVTLNKVSIDVQTLGAEKRKLDKATKELSEQNVQFQSDNETLKKKLESERDAKDAKIAELVEAMKLEKTNKELSARNLQLQSDNGTLKKKLESESAVKDAKTAELAEAAQSSADLRSELARITAGARAAAELEDLQWIEQRRFARKVDDPSISGAFLLAAYLALYQYLRGVVENQELLQRLGIVNLRTLLRRTSSVTTSDDWEPRLTKLVPGALAKTVPEADISGTPELEQLVFLKILNNMGTTMGKRIDNNLVRVSPLYYRAGDGKVLGVR